MDINDKKIYNLVAFDQAGKIDYLRGKNYSKKYIEYKDELKTDSTRCQIFDVESQSNYNHYKVEIRTRNGEVIAASCNCPRYQSRSMCKHIAAVLTNYKDDIFYVTKEEKDIRDSLNILKEFYIPPKENKVKIKKLLNLSIEVDFSYNKYYKSSSISVKFKIGENKLYNLNNKLPRFLDCYKTQEGTVTFGKDFTYDPELHYFSKNDEKIIEFLNLLYENNPYYNYSNLVFSNEMFNNFLNLLENKEFTVNSIYKINKISTENPLKIELKKQDEFFYMTIDKNKTDFLTESCEYCIKYNTLYCLNEKLVRILTLMEENKLKSLKFKEKDLELFTNGILNIVKEDVIVDESASEKIIIGTKPKIQIYFDLKEDIVLCNIKLYYQDKEIDIFDETPNIIRDKETENEVINEILNCGFEVQDKKIFMSDTDLIGNFLEEGILSLANNYEIFTSDKMKETKVLKDNNIRSSFSIGQDNILKYEFDLGAIKNEEIVNILESMKSKKKYYRLKNGDLINLDVNDDLKELESLMNDMDISSKDLKNGSGVIPKYRAIYLDSIKKEKYNIIKTNNLFDELINNFVSYKNKNISLSKKDKTILRDYQVMGVKWLYNIYKCGFGGILADEMGLGKSVQLIYFIKEIFKEKKDAKILIVAPTSLIYNWKSEFDKFGSELKYKVFAENRSKRTEELEHLENVNILITTYGLIRQDREKYLNINFELIAIDEAQNIKNSNASMTKVIKELKSNAKVALTGTPLENSVLELWSIFDFIMPGYLANQLTFSRKYNIKDVEEDNLKQLSTLNKQIKPFILRRKKKDVVKELPDKIENTIYIDLNKEQKKLYVAQLEKTKKELDEIIAEEGFKKGNFKILQLLGRLRQLCIDPRIIYENYEGGSSKIVELIPLVKGIIENGHKILLFTSYKTALDIVNREFTNHNISTYVIDGSVPSKKRIELVNKFNSDNTNVFLITLKSGGTGLNLTSADVVIHLDLWWNPQVENQATDRAHRIGQKNTVEVIKLICKGTIEERILELQNKKKILSDNLLDGEDKDQHILSKLTEKDIKDLLSLENDDE